ncbi:MAG: hypothetical protein SFY69_13555 [Planctomycetota bacterium]|nr:hypothetical protein [Planctomycetota bacterium]
MARPSPILATPPAPALVLRYGGDDGADVAAAWDAVEIEYAWLRKHAVVLDCPQRGVVEVRGGDRLEFLNRMLTQELAGVSTGDVRRSFWLNKKGRVDADLRVLVREDRVLLEVDVLAARRVVETLSHYVIAEDVTITDVSDATHRMSVHGPEAARVLGEADLLPDRCAEVPIGGVNVLVFREDTTGDPGFEMIAPVAGAPAAYAALLASSAGRPRAAGWHAWNIARIEGGTPVYNIDFGPESLPAETGVLGDRVSFTKGCYLGQEVVARMHARKALKQALVSIVFERVLAGEDEPPVLAESGATLAPEASPAEVVGAVSSSCLSPMRSAEPIALASVKAAYASPGTVLIAGGEARPMRGVVQDGLVRWSRGGTSRR